MSLSPPDATMRPKYNELATSLIDRLSSKLQDVTFQYWVGIAGPPGAGKSSLSKVLSTFNRLGRVVEMLHMSGGLRDS